MSGVRWEFVWNRSGFHHSHQPCDWSVPAAIFGRKLIILLQPKIKHNNFRMQCKYSQRSDHSCGRAFVVPVCVPHGERPGLPSSFTTLLRILQWKAVRLFLIDASRLFLQCHIERNDIQSQRVRGRGRHSLHRRRSVSDLFRRNIVQHRTVQQQRECDHAISVPAGLHQRRRGRMCERTTINHLSGMQSRGGRSTDREDSGQRKLCIRDHTGDIFGLSRHLHTLHRVQERHVVRLFIAEAAHELLLVNCCLGINIYHLSIQCVQRGRNLMRQSSRLQIPTSADSCGIHNGNSVH